MTSMNYQVVRAFGGYLVGDVLAAEQFSNMRRVQQLVEQRMIAPVALGRDGYQPSADTLTATPIRPLREMISDVQDVEVLKKAKKKDSREVAVTIFDKRIAELEAVHG